MSPLTVDRLQPRKAYWEGAAVLLVGLSLGLVSLHGGPMLAVLLLPGELCLIAAGVGMLLWPGDPRLTQYASLGAVWCLLLMPVLALSGAALYALIFSLGLIAAYLCAGRVSLHQCARVAGAPEVPTHLKAAAHVGADDMILGLFKLAAQPPRGAAVERIAEELGDWEGWLSRHRLRGRLHRLFETPPDLLKVESADRQVLGRRFRHVSFDSLYEPAEDMPGASRWQGYERNRRAHAWVVEHPGPARPWLLCIHGYRMGQPLVDLGAFSPEYFHHKLGLNMACLLLPLHGPRRHGLLSGQGYLEGEFLDFIHAELQAQWDLQRLLSWLRLVKHAPRIGVYGLSLGGYNAALLAGLDQNLDCVVAGIPVTDMAATQWRHYPQPELALLERHGIHEQRVREAFSAVSPLSYSPHLPPAQLGIFAGSLDLLVWPDQPLALQQHWDGARLNWYEGAHLTFRGQAAVTRTLKDTFAAGSLIDA